MGIRESLSRAKSLIANRRTQSKKCRLYLAKYKKYAFNGDKCLSVEQYEAVITRWYHTIEKGLSYTDYRAGFGARNIDALLTSMEHYVTDGYDPETFFFKTALSTLREYTEKNATYGVNNPELERRIAVLGGTPNNAGGTISFTPLPMQSIQALGYKEFIENRHSMRHFAKESVDMDVLKKAIELAQHTPSACNRQGWRIIVINDKDKRKQVLANQNGNEGFGQEFDKLLLITADIRAFNLDREIFQPYIDGGMYAQSILNALHYYGIASVPLSAALKKNQEDEVRDILSMEDAEVPIVFIGIGNYPETCQTTKSQRHEARYRVV